jgi:hypothetical protein
MHCLIILLIAPLLVGATPYAGEFQDLGAGGRACAMGGTGFAQGVDPSALYFNPAITRGLLRSLLFMHAENFGGLVKNEYAAVIMPHSGTTLGLGLQYLSVNGIKLTTLPDTNQPPGAENPPYAYDTVGTRDAILYANFSRGNDFLGWGGSLKLYYRNLSTITGYGGGLDLGGCLNLEYLKVGIAVRDFVLAPLIWSNGTTETIAPLITFAVAPVLPLARINSRITLECAVQKNIGLPGFSIRSGGEFTYRNALSGRVGLSSTGFTLGAGFRYRKLFVDYALATHTQLKNTNKFSAGLEF